MAQIVDSAHLDTSDYLKKLKQIDANIARMTKNAQKSFDDVNKSVKSSGLQIGVTSGLVSAITTKFIELGQRATSAIADITAESVSLAAGLETTEKVFTGIFQGNKEAAKAALGEIRDESRKLGVDLTETAAAFAPFVKNIEQLTRIGKIGSALALSQPEQAGAGVRIALQEFLAGSSRSLVQRFEIPRNLGQELDKALATGGVEAGLLKFEEILKRLGRDIDTLGGGFQQAQGKAQIAGQQIQEALGGPIVQELTDQLDTLSSTLNENFDDVELVADAFGRVAANIADIIGTGLNDFLATLDSEQLTRIAQKIFDITEDARLLVETFAGADFPKTFIDGIETFATKLDEALVTATQLNLLSQAGAAKAEAEYKAWTDELERLHGEGTIATEALKQLAGIPGVVQASNELSKLVGDTEAQALAARSAAAGEEAYNKVIQDGVTALDESKKRRDENRQATEDMAEAQKKSTAAGRDEANALLEQKDRLEELAALKEEAAEAEAKVNEARTKAATDLSRDLLEIDIETERKRLDILLDSAREREDAARKNLQAIEDIQRKNAQDIADAATDLSRDEQDIATKFSRERLEVERTQAQKRVDIEVETRRRLKDIRKQFDFDSEEAERTRDAVTFLRLQRQRDQEVTTVQTDRQRKIRDTQLEGQQRREELRIQQAQELEDARLANERKLQDLQTSLERELEAQSIAFAREQEAINLKEERKLADLQTAREREREDALRGYNEKLADLETSLKDELALIKNYNAQMEEEARRHAAEMAAANASQPTQMTTQGTSPASSRQSLLNLQRQQGTYASSRQGGINQQLQFPGKAAGGPVASGSPYMVGERGPELFIPTGNGRIVPSGQLASSAFVPRTGISNHTVNNNQTASLGGLVDPGSLNAIVMRIVENKLTHLLGEVF